MPYPALYLFIGGRKIEARERETLAVLNPASGQELGRLPIATETDLDEALEAAQRAFPVWRRMTAFERGRILHKAAALLREREVAIAENLTLEEGNTLAHSRVEVQRSADILDWCAEEGRRTYGRVIPPSIEGTRITVLKEPIGPAVALTPWNAPSLMPARKLGNVSPSA